MMSCGYTSPQGLLPTPTAELKFLLGPCLQDYTKEERRKLAVKARKEAPAFGSAERQRVVDEMHSRMVERLDADAATAATGLEATSSAQVRIFFYRAMCSACVQINLAPPFNPC